MNRVQADIIRQNFEEGKGSNFKSFRGGDFLHILDSISKLRSVRNIYKRNLTNYIKINDKYKYSPIIERTIIGIESKEDYNEFQEYHNLSKNYLRKERLLFHFQNVNTVIIVNAKRTSTLEGIKALLAIEDDNVSEVARININKIDSFRTYKEDWDNDGAKPISIVSTNNSISFIKYADKINFKPFFVNPIQDGGIAVHYRNKETNKKIIFEFSENAECLYIKIENNNIIYKEKIMKGYQFQILNWLND